MRVYFQESIEDKLLVERLLNSSIVPYSLAARDKMAQLYYAAHTFDDYATLALVEIMRSRVHLGQLMRSLLDWIDSSSSSSSSSGGNDAKTKAKHEADVSGLVAHLFDSTASKSGHEFVEKTLVEQLLRKNVSVRGHFRAFVSLSCSANKSMQLVQLIFGQMSSGTSASSSSSSSSSSASLTQTQLAMCKRLIERMSSLIIDHECYDALVELVEHKARQRLTPRQRRMLGAAAAASPNGTRKRAAGKKLNRSDVSEDDTNNEEEGDDESDDGDDDDREEADQANEKEERDNGAKSGGDDDDDDDQEASSERSCRALLMNINDDGTKGLNLLSVSSPSSYSTK